MAWCATTALAGAVPWSWVRGARDRFGGVGANAGLCVFPVPPPPHAPRFPGCVWRVVPFTCPLSSLAGTPVHAVCAFRGFSPVALLVFPACPLCVRVLALPLRPRPSPTLGRRGARPSRGSGAGRR